MSWSPSASTPYAEYPNTDVFDDEAEDLVRLRYGGMTPRCHDEAVLFGRRGAVARALRGRSATTVVIPSTRVALTDVILAEGRRRVG